MNILYCNWECFGSEDILTALNNLGHNIYILNISDKCHEGYDDVFAEKMDSVMTENNTDIVITFNYFPTLSEVCMRKKCPYFVWIYDNPCLKAYDRTITNDCNYIGSFDSFMVDELKNMGVHTIHYVPLAVNAFRLNSTISNSSGYNEEVSFVGSLYNEKNDFYARLFTAPTDKELQGYIDGLINSQLKVYGYNLMEDALSEDMVKKIRKRLPFTPPEGAYITEKRVYVDYYLTRRLAYLERTSLLSLISEYFPVSLYTYDSSARTGKAENKGALHYYTQMPVLFNHSKVNLNCTLRSIRKGIPLRAMDILGCGGFLLTNYQEDLFRHYEPGVHFDYYTSLEEAADKVNFYLTHDDIRTSIARSGCELTQKEHSYEMQLNKVFHDIFS